jgi:serine/threonine-protein kinase PpkA
MLNVLVVEDDTAIRNNIVRLLRMEGYQPHAAPDGKAGLDAALAAPPDLIISDVSMPEMDGFAMVEALRANTLTRGVPVILLTALDDRANFRKGMAAGADDYLPKPFTREELLEAVAVRVKRKTVEEQIADGRVKLAEQAVRSFFTDRFAGKPGNTLFSEDTDQIAMSEPRVATVLFSDVRNFTSIAERLSAVEVAEFLSEYFSRVTEPVVVNGGAHLKFMGDGLMAVFSDAPAVPGGPPWALPHARRAVMAGLGMVFAASSFRAWIASKFASRGLPDFGIGVGMHSGEVMMCQVGTMQAGEIAVIGDTVNVASRLEAQSKSLGWSIVASALTLEAAGVGVEVGARSTLVPKGREAPIGVAEITGLTTTREDLPHAAASLTERASDIREALKRNSEITARAVKDAMQQSLEAVREATVTSDGTVAGEVKFKGYRVKRKIGSGGMSDVLLAERESDGMPVVLKVLNLDASGPEGDADMLDRFIREYALMSRIRHPNIVAIYDQGFTDKHAYIAMEYIDGGDLRKRFRHLPNIAEERRVYALSVATQIASALAEIHGKGIVHRDLKPENVMARSDGSLALADFGIAKRPQGSGNTSLGLAYTRHGEVIGTPFYLSPEQATGKPVTYASDLYALGVVLFELLAGERPYQADNLETLLAMHLVAPIPPLPPPFADLQFIVDALLAKEPQHRPASAEKVLDMIELHEMRTRH